MKAKTSDQPTHTGLLTSRPKETLMAVAMRNLEVFGQLKDVLTDDDACAISEAHGVAWRAVRLFFDEHGALPEKAQLRDYCQQVLGDYPGTLVEPEIDDLEGVIALAYARKEWDNKDLTTDKTYAQIAMKTFRRFKHERTALGTSKDLADRGHVPADVALALRGALTALDAADAVGSRVATPIFEKGWEKREREVVTSTGLDVIDNFLGGGVCKKEVICFMGPYASCKTLLAVQGISECARLCKALTESPTNTEGLVHKVMFVSYELPRSQLQERCLAHVAKVPRWRFKQLKSFQKLRRGGEPRKYEQAIFKESRVALGLPIIPERQRARDAAKLLNKYVLFLDFSATSPDAPARGCGGVKEISRAIRSELRADPKLVIHSVWVDHAAAMVGNMMGLDEIDVKDDPTRKRLKEVPKQLGSWVARAFDTWVMVLHQLSGDANSRKSTAHFHHTDSDECKSFAMYVDFAIVTGPPTEDERKLCVFSCTKHRREAGHPQKIVKIEGQFSRVKDVTDEFMVDSRTARIVSREEHDSVAPSSAASKDGKKKGNKSKKSSYDPSLTV